jgi:hypothetical protein
MEATISEEAIGPMHLILREGIYYVRMLLRGEETSIALHGISSLHEAKAACQAIFARLLPTAGLPAEFDFALAAPA